MKKKIVVIGGDGKTLVNFRLSLMKDMISCGYEVYAIASFDKQSTEILNSSNVRFFSVEINRHSLSPFHDIKYFLHLYAMLRKIKPDICLAYTIKPVIYGVLSAALCRVRERYCLITGLGYVFVYNTSKTKFVRCIAKLLYRTAFSLCDKVIFQNTDDQNYCCQSRLVAYQKTNVVNGSGVDLEYFTPSGFPEKTTFLMVARFLSEKGIFEYVEACKQLKLKYPDIRCCLVGYIDDPNGKITAAHIDSWVACGIENYGRLDDVRIALRDSSIFVLPSYYGEGLPRSILEAMAMGMPIITTNFTGCRETVIDGKNGFLIPIKNSQALYEAMLRFVNDPSLISKMGKESLHLAREKFDVNKVNQDMLTIMKIKAI